VTAPLDPPVARRPGALAIVGASVLTMRDDERLDDHTVVVEDGVIRRIGPRTEVDVAGFDVLDARGLHLIPGLVDAHVHLTDPRFAPFFLSSGVTSVRCMHGDPPLLDLRRRVEAGEIAGPRMAVAGPIVDGIDREDDEIAWIGVHDPDHAVELVHDYAEAGYDFVKGYSWLTPDVHRSIARTCAETGLHFGGHCPAALTMEEAVAAGQRSFEHLFGIAKGRLDDADAADRFAAMTMTEFPELTREGLALLDRHLDRARLRDLAARLADVGAWTSPTLCLSASVMFGPTNAPVHSHSLTDFGHDPASRSLFPDRAGEGGRAIGVLLEIVAALHDAGAPIVAGTDTPCAWTVPGSALLDELDLYVEAGLSPAAALRTAVVEPHRLLGRPPEYGTVDVGAPADLVLLDADPTRGLRPLRDPAHVLVNGWRLDRDVLARWRADALEGVS
jgi:hypothetical protein